MRPPRAHRSTAVRSCAAVPVLVGLAVCAVATPASAASLTVSSLADSGPGSLRDVLATAAAGDVVTVAVRGQVDLLSPLTVTVPVTIEGPGAQALALSGGDVGQVLLVTATGGPTTLRGLTLTDGSDTTGSLDAGGALDADGADVVLERVVVQDSSSARNGGGISVVDGSLTLRDSVVRDNTGDYYGGGISAEDSDVTVTDSLLEGNRAANAGGAVAHQGTGVLTVRTSTVRDNDAQAVPGLLAGDRLVLDHSLVADNVATIAPGVGLAVQATGDVVLTDSTVTGNGGTTPVGTVQAGDELTLDHATVVGNQPAGTTVEATGALVVRDSVVTGATTDDLTGGTLLVQHSLLGVSTTVTAGADGNLVGVDPQLGGLADAGGPTMSLLPRTGSPVIDAGSSPYTATTTDQRGSARVVDGDGDGVAVTDLGAVEAGPVAPPVLPPTSLDPVVPGAGTSPVPVVPVPVTPVLAATGADTRGLLPAGLGLLGAGALLAALTGRRRGHRTHG